MATNWSAYEAAKEIMGNNKENIAEIGSRFPLFTRTVACANNDYLLDILKALPKVTARVVETGLKEMESDSVEDIAEEAEAPKKASKKVTPKSKQPVQEDDWGDEEDETESEYDGMTGKELYALCCERGISSLCKSRSKDYLIDLLTKLDNGEIEPASAKKKGAKAEPKKSTKAKAKKAEPVEEAEDDWGDEEKEDSDPYAGKNARELFDMCKERGIKAKPKQKADVYVKLLKKADEAEAADDEDEDDDDEWEI